MLQLFLLAAVRFVGDLSAVFCEFAQRNKKFFLPNPARECPDPKNLLDLLRGENIFGFADMVIAMGPAFILQTAYGQTGCRPFKQQSLVAVLSCQVDIVRYGYDGFAPFDLCRFEQIVYADLMFQIQKARRLI